MILIVPGSNTLAGEEICLYIAAEQERCFEQCQQDVAVVTKPATKPTTKKKQEM